METDIRTLIQMLQTISALLRWIVRESGLIRPEIRGLQDELLGDVSEVINIVIKQLRSVGSEDDPIYRRLRICGLTGKSLAMKFEVGRVLFRDLNESAVETPAGFKIFGHKLKFPLKWANAILDSLAKVFPPLEAVKEFKDHVELTVEEIESEPTWGYKPIFPGI
jgi:hypothetical protein